MSKESGRPGLGIIQINECGSLHLAGLLVAVGLHGCCGSFRILLGEQRLLVGLVENSLDDLLFFGTKNLGQVFVELGLLGLQVCGKKYKLGFKWCWAGLTYSRRLA